MFYTIIEQLQNTRLALPLELTYNAAHIPFAYPPLVFLASAALANLSGMSVLDILRFVPLAASCLTLPAFWLLARAMLRDKWSAACATAAFALIPRSMLWVTVGGGLPRAPAFLFTILALHQLYWLYTTQRRRYAFTTTVWCGLTILTHAQTASVLAFSAAVFYMAYGRTKRATLQSCLVALGAIAISAPWWFTVLTRYGTGPLLAAFASGSGGQSWSTMAASLSVRLAVVWATTGEPFPVAGPLALVGAYIVCRRKVWALPAWWLTMTVFVPRAGATYASMPEALLVAVALRQLLRLNINECPRWPLLGRASLALTICLLFESGARSIAGAGAASGGELRYLVSLPSSERAAMSWANDHTPHPSRFLVVSSTAWGLDNSAEWFPALTRQTSVATVQGYEWLPAFDRRVALYNHLQRCASSDGRCLETWAAASSQPFSYVYIPDSCCAQLRAALAADPRYHLVFSGPGASIFEVLSAASTRMARVDPSYRHPTSNHLSASSSESGGFRIG